MVNLRRTHHYDRPPAEYVLVVMVLASIYFPTCQVQRKKTFLIHIFALALENTTLNNQNQVFSEHYVNLLQDFKGSDFRSHIVKRVLILSLSLHLF